jgi:hypothetical protein
MNRKNLTAAVLAGLAGAAGIASTAQAVNINPDGLGQVLIYPYYTVNSGHFTLLSVVNTTDMGKAVKVRFLEGSNSQEVLDFNLYMSEYDVWTAAIIPDAEAGAALNVTDTSCTVPTIEGQDDQTQEFITLAYAGGNDEAQYPGDGGPAGVDRLQEGHFEIIEMATIADGAIADATRHEDGRPANCAAHVELWRTPGTDPGDLTGVWLDNPEFGLQEPSGGLFGGAAVVNAELGVMLTYEARALDGYSTVIQHANPGSELPNLGTGNIADSTVYDNGSVISLSYTAGIDAVTSVFMADTMMNEYNTDDEMSALSEWVVTLPTKKAYVNGATAEPPFTNVWGALDDAEDGPWGACEIVTLGPGDSGIWDREEATIVPPDDPSVPPGDPVFSPSEQPEDPDAPPTPTANLCYEVNVIRFGSLGEGVDPDTYMGPTELLGSSRVLNINNEGLGFANGWAQVDLFYADDPNTPADEGVRWLIDQDGIAIGGLPMTGFWATDWQNDFAATNTEGVLATQHYGGLFDHKYSRLTSDTNSTED